MNYQKYIHQAHGWITRANSVCIVLGMAIILLLVYNINLHSPVTNIAPNVDNISPEIIISVLLMSQVAIAISLLVIANTQLWFPLKLLLFGFILCSMGALSSVLGVIAYHYDENMITVISNYYLYIQTIISYCIMLSLAQFVLNTVVVFTMSHLEIIKKEGLLND